MLLLAQQLVAPSVRAAAFVAAEKAESGSKLLPLWLCENSEDSLEGILHFRCHHLSPAQAGRDLFPHRRGPEQEGGGHFSDLIALFRKLSL